MGPAVGIDLGTTYSCVGIFRDDRIEIIHSHRRTGRVPNITITINPKPSTMAAPQTNGVAPAPSSAFFEHLLKYPLVSDGITTVSTTVKENKYGQQGLALSATAYETLAKPVLPYLARPLEYVSPYVQKADSFGAEKLSSLDARFPVVLKPTAEVVQSTKDFVLLPVRTATASRDHVLEVYAGERKQSSGAGVLAQGKAIAATAIVVSTETLQLLRQYLASAKAAAPSPSEKLPNGN